MPDTPHLSAKEQNTAEKAVLDVTMRALRASENKDLDGAMEMMAEDAETFEHDAPLVYHGIAEVREVCRKGMEQMGDDLKLDFEPLNTIVRDDIAVVWGLNVMEADGKKMYSRCTRIFQRLDGEWKAIHHHLSFPYDPESGQAQTDLKPN